MAFEKTRSVLNFQNSTIILFLSAFLAASRRLNHVTARAPKCLRSGYKDQLFCKRLLSSTEYKVKFNIQNFSLWSRI